MKERLAFGLALALIATGSTWAHHNMNVAFDTNERVIHAGRLAELDWRNPHVHVFVDVEDGEGRVETWSYEGPAPGFFQEREVGREAFEASIGRTVTVEFSPSRDGSASGLMRQVTLADGAVVSACPQNC